MRGRGNGDRLGAYVGWSQSDREELGILRTRVSGIAHDIQDLILQAFPLVRLRSDQFTVRATRLRA